MAGKPQVTLTFAGDSSKLETAFSKVGASARGMETDVGKASRSVGSSSKAGFDKAAEAADNVDTKAMGFRDTMTGVQDTGKGLSQIMKGDLFNGFLTLGMGVGDLASGMYNLLIPLGKTAVLKAFAAGQWLINAAMSANPIGLIIALIVGLVVVIGLLWTKNEGFRKALTAAWNAIWGALKAVGSWIKDTLWPWIKGVWDNITKAAGKVKDGIVTAFTKTVEWLKNLPGKVGSAVSGLFSKISSAATDAKNWVGTKFGDLVNTVKGLPKRIGSAAGGMFDGIKNAFRSAINWLINKWNDLSFGIPAIDTHIPGVGKIGGFTLNTPNIPTFHTGGIMPGAPGSEGLALLQAGERITPANRVTPDPVPAGDTIVYITIDGEQFQARIDKTVRTTNRELKRTVKAA